MLVGVAKRLPSQNRTPTSTEILRGGSKADIRRPEDLLGKTVGVPEYQMTAPVWIRGILQDYHSIDPAAVVYVTGGEEQPGRVEKLKLDLPPRFRVTPIRSDQPSQRC